MKPGGDLFPAQRAIIVGSGSEQVFKRTQELCKGCKFVNRTFFGCIPYHRVTYGPQVVDIKPLGAYLPNAERFKRFLSDWTQYGPNSPQRTLYGPWNSRVQTQPDKVFGRYDMPTQRLTHRGIARLEAGRWMTDYWDDRMPGFALRAHPSGTKTYIYRYRGPDGKRRRYTIGRYPTLPLADARDIARELAVKIAKGEDPQAVKEAKRRGEMAETFAELAEAYLRDTQRRKVKSWKSYQATLKKHLLPVWANREASSIERRDVIKVIDRAAETCKPSVANLIHAVIGMVFAFGVRQDLVEKNPTIGLKRKYETKGRDRFLSPSEIRRLWNALDDEMLHQRSAVRMALLTAQRIGEVLSMRWEDLDLEERVWTIPAEVAKNGLAHRVPLTPQAMTILEQMRQPANGSVWVFPSPHRGGTRHLAAVSNELVERLRSHADSHFVIHDLRRTVASHMAALKVPRLTISKVLNHKEAGITKIYDRHSYDAEKREALERWADRLEAILGRGRASTKVA